MGLQLFMPKTEYNKGLKNVSTKMYLNDPAMILPDHWDWEVGKYWDVYFMIQRIFVVNVNVIFINNIGLRMLIKKLDCGQIEKWFALYLYVLGYEVGLRSQGEVWSSIGL